LGRLGTGDLLRPVITLALTICFVWGFLEGKIHPDVMSTVTTTVLGFWFADQALTKQERRMNGKPNGAQP
jgi:hypothetical protein